MKTNKSIKLNNIAKKRNKIETKAHIQQHVNISLNN
jgi:hypothetical protein